jgi:hypothetical protein
MGPDAKPCAHHDVREFEGVRCCMSCGETVYTSDDPLSSTVSSSFPKPSVYTPFNYSYNDNSLEHGLGIRLVVLLPGDYADPLHCFIHEVSLSENPQYEAVSYTWATEDGDDARSARVYCDSAIIPVTENCEAVLRRLRLSSMARSLWIDSICINQSNIKERNHQVGVMDKIYKSASAVQICIQDPKREYSECLSYLSYLKGNTSRSDMAINQTSESFRRRYFQRVWVIQEVMLARSAFLAINDDSVELTHDVIMACRRDRIVPTLLANPKVLQAAKDGH